MFEANEPMLSTSRTLAITGLAGIAGSMLGFVTLQFDLGAALGALTFAVVFTLAGAFFGLMPTFHWLRYSLRWPRLASCVGVFATGTIVGRLALGAPNQDLFGPVGELGLDLAPARVDAG
jgi:hypothetical protein